MPPSSSIQNLAGGGLWPGEEVGRRGAQTDHLCRSPIPRITSMNGRWSSSGPDILLAERNLMMKARLVGTMKQTGDISAELHSYNSFLT